jgi:hypothetical protein
MESEGTVRSPSGPDPRKGVPKHVNAYAKSRSGPLVAEGHQADEERLRKGQAYHA